MDFSYTLFQVCSGKIFNMISVITPVYNGEKYIKETVDSVLLAIRNHDVEYIVVDDGSNDATRKILDSYGSRIIRHSKENGGESSAVNAGLEISRGEVILIVSADDPLPSSQIFDGVEAFFHENPDVVAWYPNWLIIDENGGEIRKVEVDEYSDDLLIGRFRCIPGPGTIFRRSSAVLIGGRNLNWTFVGDYDFWLRLSRTGKLVKRNQVLAQWRFHSDSTSIAKRGLSMAMERVNVIDEFLKSNNLDHKLARKARAHAYYFAARLSFFNSEIPGKKFLWKALKSNRFKIEDGQLRVYLFIFLLPFSRFLVNILKPVLRKFDRALT